MIRKWQEYRERGFPPTILAETVWMDAGPFQLPMPLPSLIQQTGAQIDWVPPGTSEHAGANPLTGQIWVSHQISEERRRASMAYEFARLMYSDQKYVYWDRDACFCESTSQDGDAHFDFALELITPAKRVSTYAKVARSAPELSALFGVSNALLNVRIYLMRSRGLL